MTAISLSDTSFEKKTILHLKWPKVWLSFSVTVSLLYEHCQHQNIGKTHIKEHFHLFLRKKSKHFSDPQNRLKTGLKSIYKSGTVTSMLSGMISPDASIDRKNRFACV